MRWLIGSLTVYSVALLVAGCGGGDAPTGREQPRIAGPTAERLASLSDTVAVQLDASDPCGAESSAGHLRAELTAAINRRSVPAPYLEDLGNAVNELHEFVKPLCAAARAESEPDEHEGDGEEDKDKEGEDKGGEDKEGEEEGDKRDEGKGKGKKKGKTEGKKGDD